MEFKICPKGHYYNADIYDKCPECDAGEWDQDQDVEEEEILPNGMRLHFRTCPNGHRYNSDIYASCPECADKASVKKDFEFGEGPISGGDLIGIQIPPFKKNRMIRNTGLSSSTPLLCPDLW